MSKDTKAKSGKHLLWIVLGALLVALIVGLRVGYISLATQAHQRTKTTYNSGDPRSLSLRYGDIILVKSKNHRGAFRLLRATSNREIFDGAKYEYWACRTGIPCDFTKPHTTTHGFGNVYEGGSDTAFIRVGAIWVEWSHSNHVYANSGPKLVEDLDLALSGTTSIDQVNKITWTEARWLEGRE